MTLMTLQHKAALEIEDQNEVQRLLEERAESDIGGKEFMEWLSEQDTSGIVLSALSVHTAKAEDTFELWRDVETLLRDWIAYRVETMDDFIRADIVRSVTECEEA